jgi:hypothetical protein
VRGIGVFILLSVASCGHSDRTLSVDEATYQRWEKAQVSMCFPSVEAFLAYVVGGLDEAYHDAKQKESIGELARSLEQKKHRTRERIESERARKGLLPHWGGARRLELPSTVWAYWRRLSDEIGFDSVGEMVLVAAEGGIEWYLQSVEQSPGFRLQFCEEQRAYARSPAPLHSIAP